MPNLKISQLIFCFILISCPAFAQQQSDLEEVETQITHNMTTGKEINSSSASVYLTLGHYYRENIRLEFTSSLALISVEDESITATAVGGGSSYFFIDNDVEWIPFVGAELSMLKATSSSESYLTGGPKGGLKKYLSRDFTLTITTRYLMALNSKDNSGGTFFTTLGFSYLWNMITI